MLLLVLVDWEVLNVFKAVELLLLEVLAVLDSVNVFEAVVLKLEFEELDVVVDVELEVLVDVELEDVL